MTKKKPPQPIGKTTAGCLAISCRRTEITGPRGKHLGWRTKSFIVDITHRLHEDFDLLGWHELYDADIHNDDPFYEVNTTKPMDRLGYRVSELVSTFREIFADFPSETYLRESVRVAYAWMREMEASVANATGGET